jgi:sulfur relay (sulfurtransferase) DsrC/TusE family protein
MNLDLGAQTIDEYLAPLSGQLGTGLFLGDERVMLPKITSFLKQVGVQEGDPYVPSAAYFEKNKAKLDTQMQNISGMGYSTWRALTKKGELSMIEDVAPAKFTMADKVVAANDLALSMKNFDLFYPANTPQAETYAMLSKYLLIKQEAMDRAQTEVGPMGDSQTLLLRARAYENEMLEEANIDFNRIGTEFGIDANVVKTIATEGNPYLRMATNMLDEMRQTSDVTERTKLENDAIQYMNKATEYVINTQTAFAEKAAGKGEYDASNVQKNVVKSIKTTFESYNTPEKTQESIKHMVNVLDNKPSEAKANSITDNHGQKKVDYAYLVSVGGGKRRWHVIDSNGVEIRTSLFEKDFVSRDHKDFNQEALYATIHEDIKKQIKTGYVDYRNVAWAKAVADQLGYVIDTETGLVIEVRGQSIKNEKGLVDTSKALYHGFRHTAIEPEGEEPIVPEF